MPDSKTLQNGLNGKLNALELQLIFRVRESKRNYNIKWT